METNKGIETFYAPTRGQWREWLEKNGQSKKEVYLIIYHTKSKTESVSYNEAVEEALCFGWIDSLTNKRDAESVYQRFSPRKPNSNWSTSNRERVERLIKEGLMTRQGQKSIDISKQKGKWESAGAQQTRIRRREVLVQPLPSTIIMRDKRFIAQHRGGPLNKEQHRQLMHWACGCARHVLPLLGGQIDARLQNALLIAGQWAAGSAAVGEAMKASLAAHAVAREATHPVTAAVARSVGQAVATAHMADHSLGAALYALKAVQHAGNSVEVERNWQNEQLPSEITELVLTARREKEKAFKIE